MMKSISSSVTVSNLPMKHPSDLEGLEYIGVDEVARAKGHDYVTVVYDLGSGDLLWVHEGRTAAETAERAGVRILLLPCFGSESVGSAARRSMCY